MKSKQRFSLVFVLLVAAGIAAAAVPQSRSFLGSLFARNGNASEEPADSEAADRNASPKNGSPRVPSQIAPLAVTGVIVDEGPFVMTVRGTGRTEAVRRAELAPDRGRRALGGGSRRERPQETRGQPQAADHARDDSGNGPDGRRPPERRSGIGHRAPTLGCDNPIQPPHRKHRCKAGSEQCKACHWP